MWVTDSYVLGLVFLRLGVSFFTFGVRYSYVCRLVFLRLGVSDFYVWGLTFSYVWGLCILTFSG